MLHASKWQKQDTNLGSVVPEPSKNVISFFSKWEQETFAWPQVGGGSE